MADGLTRTASNPRRRSDARRSIELIIGAASTVLSERPDASMDEVAAAAGVSRQTIYAHFPSRDALVATIIDTAGAELIEAVDAAQLDTRHPHDALASFLEIGWVFLGRYRPLLLNSTVAHPPHSDRTDAHPVNSQLEQIIRQGQQAGDFDPTLPAAWLADAILKLGHTAIEHVASGRLGDQEAAALLQESAIRLCSTTAHR